jgi:hypothetical protein
MRNAEIAQFDKHGGQRMTHRVTDMSQLTEGRVIYFTYKPFIHYDTPQYDPMTGTGWSYGPQEPLIEGLVLGTTPQGRVLVMIDTPSEPQCKTWVRFSCVWCCTEEERPVPNPKTLRWCKFDQGQ